MTSVSSGKSPHLCSKYLDLFCRVFGDSEDFAKKVVSSCDVIFLLECNGEAICGTCLFEVKIGDMHGMYIYGAATDEQYRKEGFFKKMYRHVYNFCVGSGYSFIMTVPANSALFSLYWHLGFNVTANGVISLCKEKTEIILPDKCEFYDFDGDFDRLYKLHTENDILIKSKTFFAECTSEFDVKYIRCGNSDGYALFDGKDLIFASIDGAKYKSAKKACFDFFGKNVALPKNLLCDVLMEI